MPDDTQDREYRTYVFKRVMAGVLILILLGAAFVFGSFMFSTMRHKAEKAQEEVAGAQTAVAGDHGQEGSDVPLADTGMDKGRRHLSTTTHEAASSPLSSSGAFPESATLYHGSGQVSGAGQEAASSRKSVAQAPAHHQLSATVEPKGVALVTAIISPLDHEINERFWGWRPNDMVDIGDNTKNFQLGVLEATRRTTQILLEQISRTGSTASLDPNLENALNFLMIKADRYWFPSPESAYNDAIRELKTYRENLKNGHATFFSRSDNLIPLLESYTSLLGSCDENLAKSKEADGSAVSTFRADDYFYYAKGVATALATVLEAVNVDFEHTLKPRHGDEVLHHAIVNLKKAASLSPWIVTNADYDGILANHRANMAVPISHARFYLDVLIKTLST